MDGAAEALRWFIDLRKGKFIEARDREQDEQFDLVRDLNNTHPAPQYYQGEMAALIAGSHIRAILS